MTHPSLNIDAWASEVTDDAVIIADGRNARAVVRDGRLVISDGPRSERSRVISRMPRNTDRLVIVAAHGFMTMEAQRWLADSGIPWSVHDRAGAVIATSPPSAPNARMLRAQCMAAATATGVDITRHIMTVKLSGQADVLSTVLHDKIAARLIRSRLADLKAATSIDELRGIEGAAGAAYWDAWRAEYVVPFSAKDAERVPEHWQHFAGRTSYAYEFELNRNATDVVNALLNYAYGIGETTALQACYAFGMAPTVGIFHADKPGRNSMALDLIECIRPACDRIVLDVLARSEFDRRWVHETSAGVVRIDPPLSHHIAGHSGILARVIAPYAEHVARMLAKSADGAVTVPKAVKKSVRNRRA